MKRNTLTILFAVGLIITQAQENYIPGYVIKTEGDSIKGFIDFRDWTKNPKSVDFKESINGEKIEFSPMEIEEFGFENEIFVSAIVEHEVSPTETSRLTQVRTLDIRIDTTFLQTLIKGPKSLYYFKSSRGRKNFYVEQNGNPELLIYKRYEEYKNETTSIQQNETFKNQLKLYFDDCQTIESQLKFTNYDEKSLMKLFQFYQRCTSVSPTFQRELPKTVTRIGGIVSFVHSTIKYNTSSYLYRHISGTEFNNTSSGLAMGFFLDFVLPKAQGKWSIYNEMLITRHAADGPYEMIDYLDQPENGINTVKITSLTINNMLRYTYPKNELKWFLNAGIYNSFTIKEDNTRDVLSEGNPVHAYDDEAIPTRKMQRGLLIGGGLRNDRYSGEIRYARGSGPSNIQIVSSPLSQWFLLLGYRF